MVHSGLLTLFSLFVIGFATYQPNTPLFVWSGTNFLSSRGEHVPGYFTTKHTTEFVKSLWNRETDQSGLVFQLDTDQIQSQGLELVVLVLDTTLSAEELSRYSGLVPTLSTFMKTTNSFYVPYVVESEYPTTHPLLHTALKYSKSLGGTTFYLGSETSTQTLIRRSLGKDARSFLHLQSLLTEISPFLSNGVTDLLIINVDEADPLTKLTSTEARLAQLKLAFDQLGFSKYVALLTGIQSSLNQILPSNTDMEIPEWQKRTVLDLLQTPPPAHNCSGGCPKPPEGGNNGFNIYFNGTFWELATVLIIFFGFSLFGALNLLSLQSPDRIPVAAQKKKN
eukprot:TRINITY_DN8761_c0_g1_i3.p1 TRINITY_DN8761_c0_g1~~TRINITY_DN8761_c0_g1_i3.p1  ORF type:complete len:337 (+),score=49.63 TRINITY_DN8761_c0_g1_i3:394-1404(+)